ncbi:MAG: hypothetical protein CML89_06190 [Rhodobiaceae bacterium]|nr:hypothetical protein [Rhodobiaceae bacterium]
MTKLNLLYASEMGTAMEVADNVALIVKEKSIDINQAELNDISMDELSNMNKVLIITSTTGDGDLPMMGEVFWEELSKTQINLKDVEYSVCALGDSSHFHFCGAGKKVDERLEELGARKVLDRHECDGDTEGYEEWATQSLDKLGY